MSGYPHAPPNYGYGQPYPATATATATTTSSSSAYGAPPPSSSPYGSQVASPYAAPSAPYAPPPHQGGKPPKDKPQGGYGAPPPSAPAGYPAASAPGGYPAHGGYSAAPGGYPAPPPPSGAYGSPFAALVPSQFPPGTDPSVVACFQMADQDGSGLIDDRELQSALSSYNQGFSLRTVHLLMYLFTSTNTRKIGPKEFVQVFYSLQSWRAIFERFDRDRSGRIDANELREALLSLGFSVSPVVLDLLLSKFDKTGGRNKAIEYDNFIECCLTVKGLTEKFKEKDTAYSGSATFTYEAFMLAVLPFLIA
ncbi:calcium-binding protein CBP-like [Syzygium oleosum]|uniref:calcium-binding protein CBP-like n=1 Tax=Syzygium oleosum TaxID=219896 RepID=UPI0024BB69A5|nr:calcium-binding protein CBP-like [Syzygium oleosum]